MELIEDWQTEKLTCEQCGSKEFVKWKNYDKILCQKCIVPDILENNQLSLFSTQE